jgi:hypothetical protein
MVHHFKTKKEAAKFKEDQEFKGWLCLHIYKKVKGHKNRTKKPFVVCSHLEWLNLY